MNGSPAPSPPLPHDGAAGKEKAGRAERKREKGGGNGRSIDFSFSLVCCLHSFPSLVSYLPLYSALNAAYPSFTTPREDVYVTDISCRRRRADQVPVSSSYRVAFPFDISKLVSVCRTMRVENKGTFIFCRGVEIDVLPFRLNSQLFVLIDRYPPATT